MKKFTSIFIIILLMGCAGADLIPEDQRDLMRIIDLPGMKKNIIYDKTIIWIAENYKSAKAVLELQDKVNGKIVGNGSTIFEMGMGMTGRCTYKFSIDIKDNKIKIIYRNFHGFFGNDDSTGRELRYQGEIESVKKNVNLSIDSLISFLQNKKSNDW